MSDKAVARLTTIGIGLLCLFCFALVAHIESKRPHAPVAKIMSTIFYPDSYCTKDYIYTWPARDGICYELDDPKAPK